MGVQVKLKGNGTAVAHGNASKWIVDPGGNLVILNEPVTKGGKAEAVTIYAAASWTKAEVI